MAETEGGSPISLDSSVQDLFAEAVASVERHAKRGPQEIEDGEAPLQDPPPMGESLVVDFEVGDLDDLAEADPPPEDDDPLGIPEPDRRALELEEELDVLRRDLDDARARLRRREQDISNMLKRFEEAQRRYKAKVREAEISAQRAAELKEQVDHRGGEIKRLVDRMKMVAEQTEAIRRRFNREKAELQRYGSDKPFRGLLAVVDNFERALLHAAASPEALQEGVEMILAQLLTTMAQHGVKPVATQVGDPFDPNVHEAMVRVTTDTQPPGTVYEVMQKGYLYHDRLLRAALVSVAQPDASTATAPSPAPTPLEEAELIGDAPLTSEEVAAARGDLPDAPERPRSPGGGADESPAPDEPLPPPHADGGGADDDERSGGSSPLLP